VYDIAVDCSGNAFVTGRQYNLIEADDILTMKLAGGDGEVLWDVLTGGPQRLADRGWSIVVGSDGNPVVTGVFSTLSDPADYCTIKFDSTDGSVIWSRTVPGAVNHIDREAGWLGVCGNDDIIMANRTWESGTSYDVVLHRYAAADGDTLWKSRYNSGGTTSDDPSHMTLDGAGNPLVAGVTSGDYMALKFDAATGDLLWDQSYEGPAGGYDAAAFVIESPGGEVVVTGFSDGSGTSWDVATVGFHPVTGAFLWDERFDPGDGRADEGKALAVSNAGDLYVAGYGDLLASGQDMLALRYTLPGLMGVEAGPVAADLPALFLDLRASPNPFTTRVAFSVDVTRAVPVLAAVYDIRGREVAVVHDGVLPRGANLLEWDGRDRSGDRTAAGVYFMRIGGGGASAVKKIVLGR